MCALHQGPIVVEDTEEIPSSFYEKKNDPLANLLPSTRRLQTRDAALPCMRSGAVKYAFDRCRELDLTPMNVNPETLPKGVRRHCNYDSFLRKFHVFYCNAQGYARSSDKARMMLVYLKKGMGVLAKRPVKVLAILHKKITAGRNRFTCAAKIEVRFKEFLDLLRKK